LSVCTAPIPSIILFNDAMGLYTADRWDDNE
jgi:hypothetical protein